MAGIASAHPSQVVTYSTWCRGCERSWIKYIVSHYLNVSCGIRQRIDHSLKSITRKLFEKSFVRVLEVCCE